MQQVYDQVKPQGLNQPRALIFSHRRTAKDRERRSNQHNLFLALVVILGSQLKSESSTDVACSVGLHVACLQDLVTPLLTKGDEKYKRQYALELPESRQ